MIRSVLTQLFSLDSTQHSTNSYPSWWWDFVAGQARRSWGWRRVTPKVDFDTLTHSYKMICWFSISHLTRNNRNDYILRTNTNSTQSYLLLICIGIHSGTSSLWKKTNKNHLQILVLSCLALRSSSPSSAFFLWWPLKRPREETSWPSSLLLLLQSSLIATAIPVSFE